MDKKMIKSIATTLILMPMAFIIAFADWLGQQDEPLKSCYVKRLNMWGVK